MEMFYSILFKRKRPIREKPLEFFSDLFLDYIVENITIGKKDYNLKPFYYTPLKEKDEILYRQEVVKELIANNRILQKIKAFSQKIQKMRRYLRQGEELTFPIQKQRWFLDAASIYCDALLSFKEDLSYENIKSLGLSEFYSYLEKYVLSERFTTLLEETKELESMLSSVRYTIFIKGNKIKVQRYKGEKDYTKEIEEVFERFRKGKVKDYRLSFYDTNQMNHVEEKILEFVSKLYDKTFSALSSYVEKNRDFQDTVVLRFEREIQFYISYIEHIDYLEKEGLSFCIPEVTEIKGDICVRDGFDMALAFKLKNEEKRRVVCNDFSLKGNERILVVTGPNQGGKTTFARMIGQIHYFALLGLPVSGKDAKIFLIDNIYTHFERNENIKDLRGKLEDDLLRIREILKDATENSLIIMNEIFSSTTLKDAYTLANMVLEKILKLDSLSILVTFLDELTTLDKRIVSMVSLVDPNNPLVRTYKVIRKPADGLSYAMTLAVRYGLTYDLIRERIKR